MGQEDDVTEIIHYPRSKLLKLTSQNKLMELNQSPPEYSLRRQRMQ